MEDHQLSADFVTEEILENARRNAYEQITRNHQDHEDQNIANSIKKKGVCEPARKDVRRARKPRLRTVEHFLCDCCDVEIKSPEEGFIIHGNIYVADPNTIGGLIGDNFPEGDELVAKDQVTKSVMCRSCFMRALNLFKPGRFSKNEYSVSRRRN